MVGDFENMTLISTSNNVWPQNHQNQIIDVSNQINYHMADSSRTRKTDMEKPASITIQQQQAAAAAAQAQAQAVQKCPRCDSTNTKFCYYNNYSLTQPRHFCKACKRYWTRGGTLRNVPVGGGCRRNKRLKRPSNNSSFSSLNNHHNGTSSLVVIPSSTAATTTNNHIMNPLFYGLPSNPSDLNHHLPFSGYDNLDLDHGHHHHQQQQHHLGGTNLGLGFFSSGLVLNEDYRNGFASDSILSSYGGSSSSSMFGSSVSTNSSTTPTMASIIANNYHLKNLSPFENMEINGDQSGGSSGVKVEGGQQNRFANWSVPSSQNHQIQQLIGTSTHDNNPSMYWSNTNWPTADLTNIGSSLTSLI